MGGLTKRRNEKVAEIVVCSLCELYETCQESWGEKSSSKIFLKRVLSRYFLLYLGCENQDMEKKIIQPEVSLIRRLSK